MKITFITTIVILSNFIANLTFANLTITKSFDGKESVCLSLADAGSRAYRFNFISEVMTTVSREITLKIILLKCSYQDGNYKLVPINFSDLTEKYYINSNDELKTTRIKLESLKLAAFNQAGQLQALGKISKTLSNDLLVQFSFSDKFLKKAFISTSIIESTPDIQDSFVTELIGGGFILNF